MGHHLTAPRVKVRAAEDVIDVAHLPHLLYTRERCVSSPIEQLKMYMAEWVAGSGINWLVHAHGKLAWNHASMLNQQLFLLEQLYASGAESCSRS